MTCTCDGHDHVAALDAESTNCVLDGCDCTSAEGASLTAVEAIVEEAPAEDTEGADEAPDAPEGHPV